MSYFAPFPKEEFQTANTVDFKEFLSEHNRVASELKTRLQSEKFFQDLKPSRKDDVLFQEARRIVIAEVLSPSFYVNFLS